MQKIAVLDDDERWCLAIKRFFRNDFEVVTFTNAQSFLDSAIESYDAVIIDFAISPTLRYERQVSGIEIINQLKEQLEHPPMIILTSAFFSRHDSDVDEKLRSIADAILPKDLGLDEILKMIKRQLAN
ncbi:response regulator [Kovacikia minuta CCNUW1]|uniref:response regulator n=1 Tax=Kovacikia minuta TaxID=2931930 RepID=UPI001CCAB573|nr:response regulator [Kovacikia minuta]UBF26882.1 response regulator [Kovacikia minuta CCNUW1]